MACAVVSGNGMQCGRSFAGFVHVLVAAGVTGTSYATFHHVAMSPSASSSIDADRSMANTGSMSQWDASIRVNSAMAVSFSTFTTPPVLILLNTRAVFGEFVVFAIPYPVGTTFSVTRWSTVMPPASSVAALDAAHPYAYDPSSQHLFVYVAGSDRD